MQTLTQGDIQGKSVIPVLEILDFRTGRQRRGSVSCSRCACGNNLFEEFYKPLQGSVCK